MDTDHHRDVVGGQWSVYCAYQPKYLDTRRVPQGAGAAERTVVGFDGALHLSQQLSTSVVAQ